MNISVTGQTLEFLYSGLLGIGMAAAYDVFRIFRVYMRAGKVLTGIFDVIYWVAAILALLFFVLTVSGGQMRWYVLLGAFCGGFVYICTVSRLFFRALDIIIKVLIRLLQLLVKPVYFLSGKTLRFAHSADKRVRESLKKRRMKKNMQDEQNE